MKVAVDCHSPLLAQSLKKFLSAYLVGLEDADILVTDRDMETDVPILRIGSDESCDLKKPFSRSQLLIRLEEKMKRLKGDETLQEMVEEEEGLEEKIAEVTERFVQEILTVVKEHYEKRA